MGHPIPFPKNEEIRSEQEIWGQYRNLAKHMIVKGEACQACDI